jgi:hypothetical protein
MNHQLLATVQGRGNNINDSFSHFIDIHIWYLSGLGGATAVARVAGAQLGGIIPGTIGI